MSDKNQSPRPNNTRLTPSDLKARITEQKSRLDKHEGNTVLAIIEIGKLLVQLRRVARRSWRSDVQELGYHVRVANRYLAIGKSDWGQIGPIGSAIAAALPNDLHKLVWLCRLNPQQLAGLLANCDVKTEPRPKVIAEVKGLLGIPPRNPAAGGVKGLVTTIDRRVSGLADRIDEWFAEGPVDDDRVIVLKHIEESLTTLMAKFEGEADGVDDTQPSEDVSCSGGVDIPRPATHERPALHGTS